MKRLFRRADKTRASIALLGTHVHVITILFHGSLREQSVSRFGGQNQRYTLWTIFIGVYLAPVDAQAPEEYLNTRTSARGQSLDGYSKFYVSPFA
jgi:hypothetical protein